MANEGMFSFLWPDIEDTDTAKSAANLGVIAAGLTAAWTAGVVTYAMWRGGTNTFPANPLAYVDAAVFAALAFGVWRLWRAAAIAALALFLLEQIIAAIRTGHMIGLIMPIFLSLLFISGVRGTFAYKKYQREAAMTPENAA